MHETHRATTLAVQGQPFYRSKLQGCHCHLLTFDNFVHGRKNVILNSLFQHQPMRQVVDVLGRACKMRELQDLRNSSWLDSKKPFNIEQHYVIALRHLTAIAHGHRLNAHSSHSHTIGYWPPSSNV